MLQTQALRRGTVTAAGPLGWALLRLQEGVRMRLPPLRGRAQRGDRARNSLGWFLLLLKRC